MGKGTVLIIEDNESNLDIAQVLLEDAGFSTLAADNAEVGIKLALMNSPDVILMDMHLPDIDGYTAVRALKSIPEVQNIPIVAFTAQAMPEEHKKALAIGCSGVICKPIDITKFPGQVEAYSHMKPSQHSTIPESFSSLAMQLDPAQKQHFAKMFHDLKTPIAAEYQAFQVLLAGRLGPLTEKQSAFLNEMMSANRDMAEMMDKFAYNRV